MRTLRSKKLRALLYYSQDGKCAICGNDLPEDWHADHVVPWVVTHDTNVHDMEATVSQNNIKLIIINLKRRTAAPLPTTLPPALRATIRLSMTACCEGTIAAFAKRQSKQALSTPGNATACPTIPQPPGATLRSA